METNKQKCRIFYSLNPHAIKYYLQKILLCTSISFVLKSFPISSYGIIEVQIHYLFTSI